MAHRSSWHQRWPLAPNTTLVLWMCTALPSWLLKSCLVVLSMTLLTPLTHLMVCAFVGLSHTHKAKPKSTVCVIGLCFHLALVLCHPLPHTHSVCECSVPRTSTSCEWVFSRDESTGECVLGCQSVLSSLFVFFSPLFHLLTLLSCPFFTLHSPFLHAHTPAFDVIVDTLSALH